MNTGLIVALMTAIPAIISAITALIVALKSKATANAAATQSVQNAVSLQNHQIESHDKLN